LKTNPMGFRSAVFTFGVLVALAVSGCQPETETAESISLDFPNGETRLLVRRRGEARLFYAALPESLMLKSAVFDFDVLVGQLKPRLHDVVTGDLVAGRPFGIVTVDYRNRSSGDYFLYDGEFAEGLFLTACLSLSSDAQKHSLRYEVICKNRLTRAGYSG
jgi:hypothetical protein